MDNQDYVYRADMRYASDIFPNGFLSPGQNTDILAHVDGISCFENTPPLNVRSRFISATLNRQFAIDWGETFAERSGHGYVFYYVYEIRPENNMYRLTDTLHNWSQHFLNTDLPNRQRIASALERAAWTYRDQDEVIADRRISPTQIRRALIYRIGPDTGGRPLFVREEPNPRYENISTDINPGPFRQYVTPDLSNTSLSTTSCSSCLNSTSSHTHILKESDNSIAKRIVYCRDVLTFLFPY
ncbi:hypothetical protein CA266_23885 (plasmid) [Serratia marcescens]|uniref:hypothetical protein n=1 Tax=Serratia marcescens TaxID=615 RepID=UPI0018805413|nr:hypothetical protein [Serratia marcescens]QOV56305.1 hypothetical protein CA266_23885 [Serratia marcescens]